MLSGLLNRLTRKSKEPVRIDYTPLVNQLLNELPRCTSKVVAISHSYDNSSFACEIYVSSLDLLTQAEANERGVWSSDDEEQAARLAFPIWLREADLDDHRPSKLHTNFQSLVFQYPWAIADMPSARVFCPTCNDFVMNLSRATENEKSMGGWRWWTDIWVCPAGHELRHEEHEVHFFLERDRKPRE